MEAGLESLWTEAGRSHTDALAPESTPISARLGSSGVEQWTENPRVGGSIPPPGANISRNDHGQLSARSVGSIPRLMRKYGCRRYHSNPQTESPLPRNSGGREVPSGGARLETHESRARRRKSGITTVRFLRSDGQQADYVRPKYKIQWVFCQSRSAWVYDSVAIRCVIWNQRYRVSTRHRFPYPVLSVARACRA